MEDGWSTEDGDEYTSNSCLTSDHPEDCPFLFYDEGLCEPDPWGWEIGSSYGEFSPAESVDTVSEERMSGYNDECQNYAALCKACKVERLARAELLAIATYFIQSGMMSPLTRADKRRRSQLVAKIATCAGVLTLLSDKLRLNEIVRVFAASMEGRKLMKVVGQR